VNYIFVIIPITLIIALVGIFVKQTKDSIQYSLDEDLGTAFVDDFNFPNLLSPDAFNVDENGWMQNYQAALEVARKENKFVLANFTGSDWCGACHMIEKKIFNQQDFIDFAKSKLVLFKADFPRRNFLKPEIRAQNENLALKYGIRIYPTLLVLDPSGSTIAKTGYLRIEKDAYIQHLKGLLNR
jgi:thiol:disulfide interchange protein